MSNTNKTQSILETLTSRTLTVSKANYRVDLPDYFPTEVSLPAIREALLTAAAYHGLIDFDVDHFIAHNALSSMLIGFRGKVEAFAKKWDDLPPTSQRVKVESESWKTYFPARAGRPRQTEDDKALAALESLLGKGISLEELAARLAGSTATKRK